jgi:hypothetical protein
MILKLMSQDRVQQLGFAKFLGIFAIFYGFLFLGILATIIFIFNNVFSIDGGRLLEAIGFGIFMSLVSWFRIRNKE